jgi:hypothetical protein
MMTYLLRSTQYLHPCSTHYVVIPSNARDLGVCLHGDALGAGKTKIPRSARDDKS